MAPNRDDEVFTFVWPVFDPPNNPLLLFGPTSRTTLLTGTGSAFPTRIGAVLSVRFTSSQFSPVVWTTEAR